MLGSVLVTFLFTVKTPSLRQFIEESIYFGSHGSRRFECMTIIAGSGQWAVAADSRQVLEHGYSEPYLKGEAERITSECCWG